MDQELSNTSGTKVRFNGSAWYFAIAVARHYGWKSTRIEPGQAMAANDAAALTNALDRAVAAPDFVDAVIRIKGEVKETVIHNGKWRDVSNSVSCEEAEDFRRGSLSWPG